MWVLLDVKGGISIKIRNESIRHSVSLSLCVAVASGRAGMCSVKPRLFVWTKRLVQTGGAQLARAALKYLGRTYSNYGLSRRK